jgi:ribonuclease HII
VAPGPAPTLGFERSAWAAGALTVAGVDEVGRGAVAGPVVAAAVVLADDAPCRALAEVVRDSKCLSAAARATLYEPIRAAARASALGVAGAEEVDALGIARATELAMRRALHRLPEWPDLVLVDGARLRTWRGHQVGVVRGDRLVLSIAAASVLAKVWRDAAMVALAERLPRYGFDAHKGYGTRDHLAALADHGPTPQHRLSWPGVQRRLGAVDPGAP